MMRNVMFNGMGNYLDGRLGFGGGSGQSSTADLTPMLDTIFLIILLLLSTIMNSSVVRGFVVNLPGVSGEVPIQKQLETIEVSIDSAGKAYLDKEMLTLGQLERALCALNTDSQAETVFVRGDSGASYGDVAMVLCLVRRCLGDKEVMLVTGEIESGDK